MIQLIGHLTVQLLNVIWDDTFYYYVDLESPLSEQLKERSTLVTSRDILSSTYQQQRYLGRLNIKLDTLYVTSLVKFFVWSISWLPSCDILCRLVFMIILPHSRKGLSTKTYSRFVHITSLLIYCTLHLINYKSVYPWSP